MFYNAHLSYKTENGKTLCPNLCESALKIILDQNFLALLRLSMRVCPQTYLS